MGHWKPAKKWKVKKIPRIKSREFSSSSSLSALESIEEGVIIRKNSEDEFKPVVTRRIINAIVLKSARPNPVKRPYEHLCRL